MESYKNVIGAVIGMVLGDGYLAKPVGPRGHSRFTSGNIQEDYVRYKADILSSLAGVGVYRCGRMWRIRTNRHPLFTDLRRQFYPSGRKIVPRYLMQSLSPVGLALWYYDDGWLHNKELKVNLATHCFSESDHHVMTKELERRFGLCWGIQRQWVRGTKMYYLRLKASDRGRFFNLITDAARVVPSMVYKIPAAGGMNRIRKCQNRLNTQEVSDILSPQVLCELYVGQSMSVYRIGRVLNVNSGTVLGHLRKMGILIRNRGKYSPKVGSLRYSPAPVATQGGVAEMPALMTGVGH